MKRILTAVLCLAIPGMLLLNAWEGYRYSSLSDDVAALEARQAALLEANRDAIGQISYESSADRVAQKAAGLGLQTVDQSTVTRLQVDPTAAAPAAAPVAAAAATGAQGVGR